MAILFSWINSRHTLAPLGMSQTTSLICTIFLPAAKSTDLVVLNLLHVLLLLKLKIRGCTGCESKLFPNILHMSIRSRPSLPLILRIVEYNCGHTSNTVDWCLGGGGGKVLIKGSRRGRLQDRNWLAYSVVTPSISSLSLSLSLSLPSVSPHFHTYLLRQGNSLKPEKNIPMLVNSDHQTPEDVNTAKHRGHTFHNR